MKKITYLVLLAVCCWGMYFCSKKAPVQADYQVIPLPVQIELAANGSFTLKGSTVIAYPEGNDVMKRNAELLSDYLKQMTGKTLKLTTAPQTSNAIVLEANLQNENPDAYELTVTPDLITINGASAAGNFYGIQTLRKSIPEAGLADVIFPAVDINDQPRFGYRGAHFDVSRHFFPVDSVKKFIDMAALHNINNLHWHITDDQGWRLEIKKYPRLIEVSSTRPGTVIGRNTENYDSIPVSGYYTQDEVRDIIKYAADRHINIVPEIDLPGHMVAALAAYPNLGCTGGPYEVWRRWGVAKDVLCAGNDSVYQFLTDVLTEVTDLFPSEYIHIGGDECPKVRWQDCPKCQAKIKELGIKKGKHSAEEQLQSHVMTYVENFLKEKGRRVIGWDEILEGGLGPDATVMSWRGTEGGLEATRQGHDAIMTPNTYMYFDYYQTQNRKTEPLGIGGYLPVEKVYSYEPVPDEFTPEQAAHIKGVQANLWTEYIKTYPHAEYMELPRMAALSEVQWRPRDTKDYDDFLKRLTQLVKMYEALGYNYAQHVFEVKSEIVPDSANTALDIKLYTVDESPIYYTLDGSEPTKESTKYTEPLKIDKTCQLRAIAIRNGAPTKELVENFEISKATFKPVTMKQPLKIKHYYGNEPELVNAIHGHDSFTTGQWVAVIGNDFDAVVDLQEPMEISKAAITTLTSPEDWVVDGRSFAVEVSTDGKNFKQVAKEEYGPAPKSTGASFNRHEVTFNPVQARYVRIIASPENSMPDWHEAAGHKSHLFIDEIAID